MAPGRAAQTGFVHLSDGCPAATHAPVALSFEFTANWLVAVPVELTARIAAHSRVAPFGCHSCEDNF
jgi:hypothetical protein